MKQNPLLAILCFASVTGIVASASPFQTATACQPIKVSVDGEGYLRLSREGRAVYAKSAVLVVASNGRVATAQGEAVLPTIQAPIITKSLHIDLEGNVFAVRDANRAKIGRLVLALFPEGTALEEKDGVLLAADRPKLGNPGEDANGVIRYEPIPSVSTQAKSPIAISEPPKKDDPDPQPETTRPISQQPERPKQTQTPTPNKLRISAKGTPEVTGDNVTLGDIATLEGPADAKALLAGLVLGDSPALGAKRSFDRQRILARIKQSGIDLEKADITLPAMISVTRAGQSIGHAEFAKAAIKALYESPGIATEYIAEDAGPEFFAPAGPVALVAEAISGVNTATATVKIAVYVGAKRINSRTLTLKAKSLPVAAKVGAPVRVCFVAGGAKVEVQGVLRTAGAVGSSVQVEVRLPGSEKTLHTGSLLASGVVEVKL